jgi:hypothetical protein
VASSWGGSWGSSWGVSWETGAAPPVVVTRGATYGGFGPVMPEPRKKPKEIVPAYQIPELAQADVPTLKLVVFDEASEVAELLELLEMAE